MILYDSNRLRFIWRYEGSRLPLATLYACPSAALAVFFHFVIDEHREELRFLEDINHSVVWAAVVIVLGTLLGVRTNKAYDRFWEGISLVQQMRAEWFEATSNLLAFAMVSAKQDSRMIGKVKEFQHVLVRLMSLMHGLALRQIGGDVEEFDVLDLQALDADSLRYLTECELLGTNRVETLLHWIQVLVTEGIESGVIVVQAPIVTRAYQTLSRGMVNLHNARKLAEVPFPFPLAQVIVVLLIFQSFVTPFFVASVVNHPLYAAIVTFLPMVGMWSVTFIAGELEQPFGSDTNDLPLSVLQYDFNMTLLMLSDPEAARAPKCGKKKHTLRDLRDLLLKGERNAFSMTNSLSLATEKGSFRDSTGISKTSIRSSLGALWHEQDSSPGQLQNLGRSGTLLSIPTSYGSNSQQMLSRGASHQDLLAQRTKNRLQNFMSFSGLHSNNISRSISMEEPLFAGTDLGMPGIPRSASRGSRLTNPSTNPSTHTYISSIDELPSEAESSVPTLKPIESRLNILLKSAHETSQSVNMMLQLHASQLKTSVPEPAPATPVASHRIRAPKKIKTPQMTSPMSSPRDSDIHHSKDSGCAVKSWQIAITPSNV